VKKPRIWIGILIVIAIGVALYLIPAGHPEEIEVAAEFELEPLIHLPTIGPFDMSINKAVVYLWLAVALLAVFAFMINRSLKMKPTRGQTVYEGMYDLARLGIVNSVMRKGQVTWFPYVASIFFFILVSNLIGLIPLPFGHHSQLAFYAATANLYVTATLALCTFFFTHYAGIRAKGGFGYMKGWLIPGAPPVLKQLLFVMHIISEVFRLISLSVRLFANIVAGHAILAVFFAMALVFQNYLIGAVLQGGSILLYMFEIFVAFIQAFIFAILSAIYIGGSLEEEH
jgi:F-type H+-transporting ATPase subunit a